MFKNRIRLILLTADNLFITKYREEMPAWFDSRSEKRDADED